jgi:putative ABC transport system permease protein
VLIQALSFSVIGGTLGVLTAFPMVHLARNFVAWIYTPLWLVPVVLVPSLLMCVLASIASIRTAVSVEPGKVFRV